MGSIGPMELGVIVLVVLLLFGAGRIASVGKGFGQAIRQFREGVRDAPAAKEADVSHPSRDRPGADG